MRISILVAARAGLVILLSTGITATAAEIRLMSAGPTTEMFRQLGPQFERESGHKIIARFGGTAEIKRDIDAGATFDVVVTNAGAVDDWVKQGRITAVTQATVAHAGLGVGVRAGAPKPDVSSVDAARRALLGAATVGHGAESASATSFRTLLERLGILEQMKPKLRPLGLGMPYKSVAAGEVEMIVAVVPGIVAAPGVDLAGSFPHELQTYVSFAAGVSTAAREPAAAQALIGFMASPSAVAVIKANGMEPGAPR